MEHNRAYHRFKTEVKKNRKLDIIKHSNNDFWYNWAIKNRGRLDKGKVHCSCPICNGANKRKIVGPSISELRRIKVEENNEEI